MGRYLIIRVGRWIASIAIIVFITYAMMFYGAADPIKRMYMSRGESLKWLDQVTMDALRK